MRGLLVDNGSILIVQLISAFRHAGVSLQVVKISDFTGETAGYDFVVLSGSGKNSVQRHTHTIFSKELEFIKTTELPVLGICLGCELIATAFDGKLKKLPKKVVGHCQVMVSDADGLFAQDGEIAVYESHRWAVADTGPQLSALAASEHGIEALKHPEKPCYGVQFHPELSGEIGQQVLSRFLSIVP